MEREKFEASWKRAFDEAEVSPSEKVWTNIELDLEKTRGGELKRRLLFYQMLAAASVVFAMAIGGAGYYSLKNQGERETMVAHNEEHREASAPERSRILSEDPSQKETSERRPQGPAESDTTSTYIADASIDAAVDEKADPASDKIASNHRVSGDVAGKNDNRSNVLVVASKTGERAPGGEGNDVDSRFNNLVLPLQLDDRALPRLYTSREVRLHFDQKEQEIDPVVAMLARLEQREKEVRDEKEKDNDFKNENLWTSVGFSAGSFNAVQAPSASGSSSRALNTALAGPIVDQESKATGYSYSMGVNIGTRLSERWVFQGGVNYLTHSSEYTSNSVAVDGPGLMAESFKPATTNTIVSADSEHELSNRLVYSAPYSVNNSMRYISIPMQAGYLLVNKTFGLQLNAGVATDLFLQNTVEGEGDQLATTTQASGADSPYRALNLSGLFGTEFSYRFGDHYRISLNPGIRYPFNTIYKSELGVQSSPLTFDVGLRFRYIFR